MPLSIRRILVAVADGAAKRVTRRAGKFSLKDTKYRIAPRRAHLQMGDPKFVLPALARSLESQMVVMGAISRSGFDRLLLGSTVEQVLDALPCDVLVVKPKPARAIRRRK
jgi:nucleotide-binding universal stress UspA family protein